MNLTEAATALLDAQAEARAASITVSRLGAELDAMKKDLFAMEVDHDVAIGRLAVYVERLARASRREGYDPTALPVSADESTSARLRLAHNELGRWE